MSAREQILHAVRTAQPAPVPLPDVRAFARGLPRGEGDLLERFSAAARAAGAAVVEAPRAELGRRLADAYPDARAVVSTLAGIPGTRALPAEPHTLADIDLFVAEAAFGVAENGAVWLPVADAGARASLFLAPREALVLERSALVADLHEAYARLDLGTEGFGVFVAGPSKTADIEQALVIGAHGPKALTIFLV